MGITRTDIENYQQFGDPKKGSAVFANALAESLRQIFPDKTFQVEHRDPYHLFRLGSMRAMYSRIYEITGEILDFFPERRQVAFAWAGEMPHGCRNGIAIDNTEFRGILEQKAKTFNQISGAKKKIFFD